MSPSTHARAGPLVRSAGAGGAVIFSQMPAGTVQSRGGPGTYRHPGWLACMLEPLDLRFAAEPGHLPLCVLARLSHDRRARFCLVDLAPPEPADLAISRWFRAVGVVGESRFHEAPDLLRPARGQKAVHAGLDRPDLELPREAHPDLDRRPPVLAPSRARRLIRRARTSGPPFA